MKPRKRVQGPAIEEGTLAVGWPYSGHTYAETERYTGLFHEVSPKEQALCCMECHGEAGRLDFAALGYVPKESYGGKPLCAICHGDKSGKWTGSDAFFKIHGKHVEDKGYDWSACHSFSAAR